MKLAVITTAALMVASTASAFDLGNGLTAGAEVDMNYTTGVELWALEAKPELALSALSVGSTFDLMNLNGDDTFKGLDFDASYPVGMGLTAYGEVSTDADFEFGDIKVGASFKF